MRLSVNRREVVRSLGAVLLSSNVLPAVKAEQSFEPETAERDSSPPSVVWSKSYDYGIDSVNSIVNIQSGYLLAGSVGISASKQPYTGLVSVDSDGELVWNKTYGFQPAVDATSSSSNDIVLTKPSSPTSGVYGLVQSFKLQSVSSSGNILFDNEYEDEDIPEQRDDTPHALARSTDGGYVIAGRRGFVLAGGSSAYVIKTNAQGAKLWARSYGQEYAVSANAVIESSDGNYVVAGESNATGWLGQMTSAGDIIWTNKYPTENQQEFNGTVTAVTEWSEGGYIFVGTGGENKQSEWIVGVSEDGTQVFSKHGGDSNPQSIEATPDGGALIAGRTQSPTDDFSDAGYLRKIDSSGNEVWSKTFTDGDININSMIMTGEVDFLVGGDVRRPNLPNQDYWLSKLSASPTATFEYSIAGIDSSLTPEVGDTIVFNASQSSDQDGSIDRYDWDFDADGTFDARGVEVTHTYDTVGGKSPTLQVSDIDRLTASTTRSLTIGLPGRRRTRRLAAQIDTASVHSDIEDIIGDQLDGALELATPTLDALRETVVDERVDLGVAEDAVTRLQTVEELSRDLVRRLGPTGDSFLARQLVRKAIEAAAALVVVAISLKIAAATGTGLAAVIVGGTVGALLDAASFVLGDWLAPDSDGNSSYRQQADQELRDGASNIVDEIKAGTLTGAQAIAAEINDLVDTVVETAADGLRAVIELNVGDFLAEINPLGTQLLGTGDAVYRSLADLNQAYAPSSLESGLMGTTETTMDAVATGRSQLFGTIDTTSRFIDNLSRLSVDFTNISETIEDTINGGISDLRTLAELGGTFVTGVYNGLVGAATATVGAAVGPPLVAFIKTIHQQIVQSAIQGENVGFTSL